MHGMPMVMLAVAVCVILIVLRAVTLTKDREARDEETRMLRELRDTLAGLEHRVRNLETVLDDRRRRDVPTDSRHNDRME